MLQSLLIKRFGLRSLTVSANPRISSIRRQKAGSYV